MRDPLNVEVSPLLNRRFTGIARFTARLVEALSRVVTLRLFCALEREEVRQFGLRADLVAGQEILVPRGTLGSADADVERWTRALLSRPRNASKPDPSHACVFTQLRPRERRFHREIGILYDFTPLLLPWAHVPGTRALFGEFFTRTARLCDKVIAISRATKSDARWLSTLDDANVVLGYPGPSLCVEAHAAGARNDKRRDAILVVSTREPRKNGAFLLDWFHSTRVLSPDTELWCVGPSGWLPPHGLSFRAHRRVRHFGNIPDHALCELYHRAAFTIYPSLYEGFGFPVLDSLHHGVPVACAFNSSLQEFAGAGVFFFDACDPASLDATCQDLLACPPCPVSGRELAARFSWDRLASTVLDLTENGEPSIEQTGLALMAEN